MLPHGARGAIPPEACIKQSATKMVSGRLTMLSATVQPIEERCAAPRRSL